MKLASIVDTYRERMELKYGHELLAGHLKALDAIAACRTADCGEMLVECPDCGTREYRPHSCGHRSCPQCQNHEVTQWLNRQRQKLLPVSYFLVTLTLPAQLRALAWNRQREVFDAMFKAAIEAMRELASNPRYLGGEIGATGVLHTNTRRLDFHPHLHFVVPAGAIDVTNRLWKKKRWRFLFPEKALAKLFRGKLLARLDELGFHIPSVVRGIDWVADCECVGRGETALEYLARYLYRGVVSEDSIIADENGMVTFSYVENATKAVRTRTLPGEDFLWLVIRHVLPKGFRRARDYGFHHGNARKTLVLLQLILHVKVEPGEESSRPIFPCPKCGKPMRILAVGLKGTHVNLPPLANTA